jgi:FSR family fosmidomycin resistance protein-like MFS transporter
MTTATAASTGRGLAIGGGIALLLSVAHLANDAITSMLTALLPTLQQRFGLAETVLALLVATFSFSSSVTQPVFGAVSDRLGRRPLAAFGLVLSVSLLSLMAVAPGVWTLFGLLLVGGLGSAAFHPSGTSIARAASGDRKELAVGMFSAGGMLGLALGPIVVLVVATTLGLGYTPWLMVPGLVLGMLVNLLAPSEGRASSRRAAGSFDAGAVRRLVVGPVGLLAAAGTLMELAFVTFTSAVPIWLVAERGIARDGALLSWTLAVFYLAAALGGIAAGLLSRRASRRLLTAASMLAAPLPLFAVFALEPGTVAYFLAVALAGALTNAGFPLLIVSAQDLAPEAEATASGMLMGLTVGVAGLLYVGIGRLQETLGLTPAMGLGYLTLVPASLLTLAVLAGRPDARRPEPGATRVTKTPVASCACSLCACGDAQAAGG